MLTTNESDAMPELDPRMSEGSNMTIYTHSDSMLEIEPNRKNSTLKLYEIYNQESEKIKLSNE